MGRSVRKFSLFMQLLSYYRERDLTKSAYKYFGGNVAKLLATFFSCVCDFDERILYLKFSIFKTLVLKLRIWKEHEFGKILI